MRFSRIKLPHAALLICLLLIPTAGMTQAIDRVLVVVNEEAITLSEYVARHRRETLQQSATIAPFDGNIDERILNLMIDDRIQMQTALRNGIQIAPQEVEQAIAAIAEQNQVTPEGLYERLTKDGITVAQFRASVREQQLIRLLVNSVVNSRVVISAQEVENYLARHQELNVLDQSFEVSHLFISIGEKTESQIQSEHENLEFIRNGIIEGRAFEKSVQEFSDNTDKEAGGYLGWRTVNQLPHLFVDSLRRIDVGEITDIIRSENGLHLLKLHERSIRGIIVEQQRIKHILIRPDFNTSVKAARELIDELYSRIIAGEEFEKLARTYSADKQSGAKGGLLGWINPGEFSPEFEEAAYALKLNQVSEPLQSPSGYHLIKVIERRNKDISTEIANKRARQQIFRRKAAEFYDNWHGTLRDTAHIEYLSNPPG